MEKDLNGFDEFWSAFPRRVEKIAARKAYKKALTVTTAESLIEGAKRYAAKRRNEDVKFTKHPASWLNCGCWEDDAPMAPIGGSPASQPKKVFVEFESPQWRAWTKYLGKTPPMNRNFGWDFDSEWPPTAEV